MNALDNMDGKQRRKSLLLWWIPAVVIPAIIILAVGYFALLGSFGELRGNYTPDAIVLVIAGIACVICIVKYRSEHR